VENFPPSFSTSDVTAAVGSRQVGLGWVRGGGSLYQPGLYAEMGGLWKISEKTSNLRPAITSLYRRTREAHITQTPFMEGDPSARKRIF